MQNINEKYFNKVYLECYGRPSYHSELEDYLKKTKAYKIITLNHLQKILSDSYWNFSKTWNQPTDSESKILVKSLNKYLKFVNDDSLVKNAENKLITQMVDTIKNIEIVSVILAFLIPNKYCILAPPPEHMIGFRRHSNKVDTLLRYFKDFQELAICYDIGVFELEKALWTIYQLKYKIPDYDTHLTQQLWDKYLNDSEILRVRVKNLLNEIWGDHIDDNLKAKILKEKDPEVALILAMRYFEHSLWEKISKKSGNDKLNDLKSNVKVGSILNHLMPAAGLDPELRSEANRIWKKRNLAMHSSDPQSNSQITSDDVKSAIELNSRIN